MPSLGRVRVSRDRGAFGVVTIAALLVAGFVCFRWMSRTTAIIRPEPIGPVSADLRSSMAWLLHGFEHPAVGRVAHLRTMPHHQPLRKASRRWTAPAAVPATAEVACDVNADRRIDLVVAESFLEVIRNVVVEIQHDPLRPIRERITDLERRGGLGAHGIAWNAMQAKSCGLCSVTVVKPYVAPDGDGSSTQNSDVEAAALHENIYGRTPPVAIDSGLCGSKHRTLSFVRVAVANDSLSDWHTGVFEAIDRVVDNDSVEDTAVVSFLHSGSPPEQPMDQFLSDLASGVESAEHKTNLVGCPLLTHWGDPQIRDVGVGDDREVEIGSFGYEAVSHAPKLTTVLKPKFHGYSRHIEDVQRDAAVDAIASNCFATDRAAYRRLRASMRLIEPTSVAAAIASTRQRAAELATAVTAANGFADATKKHRGELIELLQAAIDLLKCSELLKQSEAAAKHSKPVLRACARTMAAKEGFAAIQSRTDALVNKAYGRLRRDAILQKAYRLDALSRRPDAEVTRRAPLARAQLAALAAMPEVPGCAVALHGSEVTHCAEGSADKLAQVKQTLGDAETLLAVRGTAATDEQLRPLQAVVSTLAQRVKEVGADVRHGVVSNDCSSCQCNSDNENVQKCKVAVASLHDVIKSNVASAFAASNSVLQRANVALINATMVTPTGISTHTWMRFVTAAHMLGMPVVVRAAARTVDRQAPTYTVKRLRFTMLDTIHPYDQYSRLLNWQANMPEHEIHPGLSTNGAIVKTFEQSVKRRWKSASVRAQVTTGSRSCDAKGISNNNLLLGLSNYVPAWLSLTPILRCQPRTPAVTERLWSAFAEADTAGSVLASGNKDVVLGNSALTSTGAVGNGAAPGKVLDVLICQGDPHDTRCHIVWDNLAWKIVRVGCQFDRIPPQWVPFMTNVLFDETWANSESCKRAIVQAGVPAHRVHVIPEAIDTRRFHPRFGRTPLLPQPDWRAYRVGGTRNPGDKLDHALFDNFKFFAHFRWCETYDWATLFSAYFKAFKSTDKVSLFVKAYHCIGRVPHGASSDRDGMHMVGQVLALLNAERRARPLPYFEIITDNIDELDLLGMYRATDAFVSVPTNDGYHMETLQAMAMGKPVLLAKCFGATEIASPTTAIFLDSQLERIDPTVADVHGVPAEANWCRTSEDGLAKAMRRVRGMPSAEREALGAAARAHVVQRNSIDAAGAQAADRLVNIEQLVRDTYDAP